MKIILSKLVREIKEYILKISDLYITNQYFIENKEVIKYLDDYEFIIYDDETRKIINDSNINSIKFTKIYNEYIVHKKNIETIIRNKNPDEIAKEHSKILNYYTILNELIKPIKESNRKIEEIMVVNGSEVSDMMIFDSMF